MAKPKRDRSGSALWLLFALILIPATLYSSWQGLRVVDFHYPQLYYAMKLDQTIATYGPRNRFKLGLERCSPEEHIRLFSEIATAIHQQGDSLEGIFYRDRSGVAIGKLLRNPEIQHLQDVAKLIDAVMPLGLVAALMSLLLAAVLWVKRLPPPGTFIWLKAGGAVLLIPAAFIALIGPTRVFYALHEWVFPPGHEWFFYYEDSLMTTLMRAPDLFAAIAGLWLLYSVLFYGAAVYWLRRAIRG